MGTSKPVASIRYVSGQVEPVLAFLKRTRSELSELRLVRVWPDRLEVVDVNGDAFEVRGLGYPMPDIVPVLDAVNAVYRRDSIHHPLDADFKQFKTGRRYPWAADRVM